MAQKPAKAAAASPSSGKFIKGSLMKYLAVRLYYAYNFADTSSDFALHIHTHTHMYIFPIPEENLLDISTKSDSNEPKVLLSVGERRNSSTPEITPPTDRGLPRQLSSQYNMGNSNITNIRNHWNPSTELQDPS